jgi:hypothetical protein
MNIFKSSFSVGGKGAVLAAAVFLVSVSAQSSFAQRSGASPAQVSSFLSNPKELLNKSPNGGADFVSGVRDLVTGDPATLQPVLQLLANANKSQRAAIGAALAQAAKIVVRTNPGLAAEIQKAVLETKDEELVLAFAAGSGDRPIGAGGAGAGGGAGGASGGPTGTIGASGGGGSGIEGIGGPGVNTPLFSYTSNVGGLTATPNNTTTTITSSVSP